MRRAVILITVLTVLCVGLGLWMDLSQRRVAQEYLRNVNGLRVSLREGDTREAVEKQTLLQARWKRDSRWLNCLISHHHTRAVSLAMIQLSTAMEYGWEKETWQALDLVEDALRDVEGSDFPYVENIF